MTTATIDDRVARADQAIENFRLKLRVLREFKARRYAIGGPRNRAGIDDEAGRIYDALRDAKRWMFEAVAALPLRGRDALEARAIEALAEDALGPDRGAHAACHFLPSGRIA